MGTGAQILLARQPILDRRSRIVAHEILFRSADSPDAACIDDVARASARVMASAFGSFDPDALLGSGLGFFNVDAELLESDVVESLPASRVVLEILEHVEPTSSLQSRCRQLRRRGFRLALDDWVPGDARAPLLDLVHFVKVDLPAASPRELARTLARLRATSLRLLAEKVETADEFERCLELGFELFQGYHFARPVTLRGRALDPARATVMELLRMLARQASLGELSDAFKRHTSLGLTLLRIVNSIEFARRQKIQHIEQALVLLGERRLRRWLSLLLFAGDQPSGVSSPLLQTAALRGRLLELIARRMGPPLASTDGQSRAFLTGMLSLADVVLGIPCAEVVGQLSLEEDIAGALVEGKGRLAQMLELAIALEGADFERAERLLPALGLSTHELRNAELEAMRWAAGLDGSEID